MATNLPQLPPAPPENTQTVYCPACEHEINEHRSVIGCTHATDGKFCLCEWTPNDVAYQLFAGGLTQ